MIENDSINFQVALNTTKRNSDKIPLPEMIYVEGGTFTMGCTPEQEPCEDNEKPVHEVTLSSYSIGKYEVTNEQFVFFLNEKGNQREGGIEWIDLEDSASRILIDRSGKFNTSIGYEKHPVVNVNWYAARAYCNWISEKTGDKYRLPSEAEWEFAARGGAKSGSTKYAGSNVANEVAWYDRNSGSESHPVGGKKPNNLGIYDMSGNVFEWCQDCWNENYSGAPNNGSAWISKGGCVRRVLRGGAWGVFNASARVVDRVSNSTIAHDSNFGFRVTRD